MFELCKNECNVIVGAVCVAVSVACNRLRCKLDSFSRCRCLCPRLGMRGLWIAVIWNRVVSIPYFSKCVTLSRRMTMQKKAVVKVCVCTSMCSSSHIYIYIYTHGQDKLLRL